MAYFFAPHQRHHGFPFPLIRNFVSEDNPSGFNWACFVLITLAEAAKHVKLQLSHGCSSVMIYGCTLLIQVFYLDNLNFGPMSPFHMDLPRIHYYTQDVIHMMSLADACPDNNSVKHGKMKLRSASDVCYSRGWHDHLKLPPYTDEMYDNQFISISEIFHRGVCLVDTLGTQLNVLADHNISSVPALAQGLIGPFNKIKSDLLQVIHQVGQKAADSIKRTNLILFAKHMPPVDGINTRKRKHTETPGVMPINPESATLLMTMQSQHMHVSEKMVVMSHSDFSQSPFELGIGHPFLSRAKRTKIYNWMMDNNLPIHVLNRYNSI